jgi:lipoprotein-releasing system permease protein
VSALTGASAPRGRAFEWFVAWRHLRDPDRRSYRSLVVGVSLTAVAIALIAASHVLARRGGEQAFLLPLRSPLSEQLQLVGSIAAAPGLLITFFGILRSASFSIFTALSVLGVFFGTLAPIVTLSVMSGFETDLKTKIRGAKADVVITTADDNPFGHYAELRQRVAAVPGVVSSTPFIEGEVMIRKASSSAGILLRGIDVESAPSVLDLARTLRDGKLDDLLHPDRVAAPPRGLFGGGVPDDPDPDADTDAADDIDRKPPAGPGIPRPVLPGILVGEELYAHTLRVFIGDDVEVVCPMCALGPSGLVPHLGQFRVAGHFYSGMYEFDSKLAYVTLAEAQRFLGMPGEVSGIDVRTRRPEDARGVADALQALLGPGFAVRSWEDLNKGLFMALRLEKLAMFVVLAFIALVASFSIISTLIMSVTQKAREVAILKSMGATDGAIRRVFFAEGLYIGLLGLSVGVASGVLACKLIMRYGLPLPTDVYYINQLPVVMRAGEIIGVATLALLLCCLATVYPAIVASRLRPVDGLRYE